MKRFLFILALFVTTLCLTACNCGGNRNKPTVYECTYWQQTKGTIGLNMLKNDDGTDVFDYYQLWFYKDGSFKLVFKIKDQNEEVYNGDYSDKDGVRSLYYDNKPDEFQDLYGASKYTIGEDGSLTRKQQQFPPSDGTTQPGSPLIISQKFQLVK